MVFAENNLVIIANNQVPVNSLSSEEIKNIFLGKKTQWDNGEKIKFVLFKKSELSKKFLKEYIKKTPSQYKRYWKGLCFTGKARTPKTFQTQKDIIEYISNNKNTIGYINIQVNKKDKLKIISIKNKKETSK